MPRKGFRVSEATKQKISASNKKYFSENPLAREQIAERMRKHWRIWRKAKSSSGSDDEDVK